MFFVYSDSIDDTVEHPNALLFEHLYIGSAIGGMAFLILSCCWYEVYMLKGCGDGYTEEEEIFELRKKFGALPVSLAKEHDHDDGEAHPTTTTKAAGFKTNTSTTTTLTTPSSSTTTPLKEQFEVRDGDEEHTIELN